MVLKIYGNKISGTTVGISVPANANVDIRANAITNCRTAIEVRDEVSLRAILGLSKDATADQIAALFHLMNSAQTEEAALKSAQSSGAAELLSAGANISTLVSGFFQLKESGLVNSAIAILSGQA